ncbi:MAG: amidohydrolase, partial [Gammaproteobacteria bacterium]|nr:amidohydrolase [Gammaproteobacteria bacterium]
MPVIPSPNAPWRAHSLLCAAALAVALAGCSGEAAVEPAAAAIAPDPDAIAFVGVNVAPMDSERVLEGHTVVVQDGRISSVTEDDSQVPEGARRIDGEGRWLMPGLAEMHGHVPGPDDPDYAEDVLFLYVSNGVTTVRNMAGHASHLALRDRVEAGELVGPTLFAASPWLTPETAGTPEAARQAVRDYQAAGFDLLKLGTIDAESYAAMAAAAHEIGMPFGGHIPAEVGLVAALDARQTSIDHYDRYVEFLVPDDFDTQSLEPGFFGSGWVHLADRERIPEAIERTLAAGTWNVPTLSLVEHLASDTPAKEMIAWPEMRYMPQRVREGWVEAKHR